MSAFELEYLEEDLIVGLVESVRLELQLDF